MSETYTVGNTVLIIVSIITALIFLYSISSGWLNGGKRNLSDIIRTLLQISITLYCTYYLTTHYSLYNEQNFYNYITANGAASYSAHDVNALRFLRCGYIWFFVSMIAVELIFAIVFHFIRKHQKKEDRKHLSTPDRVLGAVLEGMICMMWLTLPAPAIISTEKIGLLSNGTDLINKTLLTIPVNYIAKPIVQTVAKDSPAARIFDDGLEVLATGLSDLETWMGEHADSVVEIMDLTKLHQ